MKSRCRYRRFDVCLSIRRLRTLECAPPSFGALAFLQYALAAGLFTIALTSTPGSMSISVEGGP